MCHKTQISPDTLIPSRKLRKDVLKFKNETGYAQLIKTEDNVTNAVENVQQDLTAIKTEVKLEHDAAITASPELLIKPEPSSGSPSKPVEKALEFSPKSDHDEKEVPR